tara:strand:- start:90 stop:209 length:120 start_codon:yes stop_codon:yes gene_type:complete
MLLSITRPQGVSDTDSKSTAKMGGIADVKEPNFNKSFQR